MSSILNSIAPPPGWTPNPIAFGNIRWYAIFIICGFIVAIVLSCLKLWKRYKVSVEPFYWFIIIGVPLAIIGANFGSCVLDSFWRLEGMPGGGTGPGKPWSQFFSSFGQGLAIEWGILFDIIAASIYFPLVLKRPRYKVRDEFGPQPAVRRVSMWLYFDAILPCVLIAQFLGRWGNYMNQEVYGAIVTDEGLSWFLHNCLPGMYINGEWRQPLFFWEGIGNLAMFFVLYFGIEAIKIRKTGDLAAGYLVWYGAFRAGLETLRDQTFKSTSSIVFSIIMMVAGLAIIVLNHTLFNKFRDYKVWAAIRNSDLVPIINAKKQGKIASKKIEALNAQITELSQIQQPDEKIKGKIALAQHELERVNQYSVRAQKYLRDNNELIYYGGW